MASQNSPHRKVGPNAPAPRPPAVRVGNPLSFTQHRVGSTVPNAVPITVPCTPYITVAMMFDVPCLMFDVGHRV